MQIILTKQLHVSILFAYICIKFQIQKHKLKQKMNTTLQYDSDAVNKTALQMTCTPQYVRLVLRGKRTNPVIKAMYYMYVHGKEVLIKATAEMLESMETVN